MPFDFNKDHTFKHEETDRRMLQYKQTNLSLLRESSFLFSSLPFFFFDSLSFSDFHLFLFPSYSNVILLFFIKYRLCTNIKMNQIKMVSSLFYYLFYEKISLKRIEKILNFYINKYRTIISVHSFRMNYCTQ